MLAALLRSTLDFLVAYLLQRNTSTKPRVRIEIKKA